MVGLITGFTGFSFKLETRCDWFHLGHDLSWGGFLILSGLASVVGTFQAKKLTRDLNPVVVNAYQFLFGSLLLLLSGAPSLFKTQFTTTPLFWGLFVYSAFLSAAAFSIWYTLLRYNKAGEITLYRFMIPVSGAILSAFFLPDESLTPSVLMALALVAFGIAAVNYWQRNQIRESAEGEL